MSILVYVESPYQLENAIKYLNTCQKSGGARIVVRNNSNATQFNQIENLVSSLELRNVSFIHLPGSGLARLLLYPLAVLVVFFKALFSTVIIIGDARSVVASPLVKISEAFKKEIILVDDGLYLLSFIRRILKKNYTIYTRLPLKSIIEESSSTLSFKPSEILKFSCQNDFSGRVNFIGMKISEIGFISEESYINYLKEVRKKFKDCSFYYYSHRGESLKKLSLIEKVGYEVITPAMSIEIYLNEKGVYKGIYITFFSTALYNLSLMVCDGIFYYIKVKGEAFPNLQTDSVLECYKLFKSAGLEELDI